MKLKNLQKLQSRSNTANLIADIGVILVEKMAKIRRIALFIPGLEEISFGLAIAADISGIVAGASTLGIGIKTHSVADEVVGIGQMLTGGMDVVGLSAKKLPEMLGESKDVFSEMRDSDSFDERASSKSFEKSNEYKPPMKTNVVHDDGNSYTSFPERQSEIEDPKAAKLLGNPPSSTPLYMKPIIGIQKRWEEFKALSIPDKILTIKAAGDVALGLDMVGTNLYNTLVPKTTTWQNFGINSTVGVIGVWESLTTASS